jgi:hypothetical protein
MIVTKVAIGLGVVAAALLFWMAVSGVAVASELLVSALAIVVLVGGGNWLAGRRGQPPAGPHPGRDRVPGPPGADGPETGAPGR